MSARRLVLHYEFIKKTLKDTPMTIKKLTEEMTKSFDVNYTYVHKEIHELISINKIKMIKHNNEMMLLWTETQVKFEHELSTNVVELDKQYTEFITRPSKVRQMKLPLFVIEELKKQIVDLDKDMELMLGVTAVKSNGVWYKIKRR